MEGSVDRDAGAMIRDGIKCMEKLGVCPEAVWKSLGRWMAWDGMGWYGMIWDGMGWYGMVWVGLGGWKVGCTTVPREVVFG